MLKYMLKIKYSVSIPVVGDVTNVFLYFAHKNKSFILQKFININIVHEMFMLIYIVFNKCNINSKNRIDLKSSTLALHIPLIGNPQ